MCCLLLVVIESCSKQKVHLVIKKKSVLYMFLLVEIRGNAKFLGSKEIV